MARQARSDGSPLSPHTSPLDGPPRSQSSICRCARAKKRQTVPQNSPCGDVTAQRSTRGQAALIFLERTLILLHRQARSIERGPRALGGFPPRVMVVELVTSPSEEDARAQRRGAAPELFADGYDPSASGPK